MRGAESLTGLHWSDDTHRATTISPALQWARVTDQEKIHVSGTASQLVEAKRAARHAEVEAEAEEEDEAAASAGAAEAAAL